MGFSINFFYFYNLHLWLADTYERIKSTRKISCQSILIIIVIIAGSYIVKPLFIS